MKTIAERRSMLWEQITSPEIVVAPGVVDALTARIVEESGFSTVYATGAGIANSQLGIPDLGLATMTEIHQQVQRIVNSVELPVIADIDTGYGNPVNVYRTITEFDRAGVAALQIEDQVSPKRCGHFAGKETVSVEEMVAKVQVAREARSDDNLLIIARTDAIATEGLGEALSRADRYRDAGADLIFVEAPRSIEELELIPTRIDAPLVVNMTEGGRTPLLSARNLQEMGYSLVIFPNALLRSAAFAVRNALAHLKERGESSELLPTMISWEDRQSMVNIEYYQRIERRYVTDVGSRSESSSE